MNTHANRRLLSLLRQLPIPRLVYDLGCGSVDDAVVYRTVWSNIPILAVDHDRVALRRAYQRDPSLLLVEAALTALPLLPHADLLLIRHPDVHRHLETWVHFFAHLPQWFAPNTVALVTTYTAPEFDLVLQWLPQSLIPLPIELARLDAVGLDGRDRYNGCLRLFRSPGT